MSRITDTDQAYRKIPDTERPHDRLTPMVLLQRIFRFAPSPNGELHLGHAYSAMTNRHLADSCGGKMLLRMEDIDTARCSSAFEDAIKSDLRWIGVSWDDEIRRQSEHFDAYADALERLRREGLVYPAAMSRREIRETVDKAEAAGKHWPRDPDGQPVYPGAERTWSTPRRKHLIGSARAFNWRLDVGKAMSALSAPVQWAEDGLGPDGETGTIIADPLRWGDVIVARSDVPTSYHLSVVVDDALQGVSDVVRGQDLFHATSIHRLLHELLGLPAPRYHHHALLLAADGRKLSKSNRDMSLHGLRRSGASADSVLNTIRNHPKTASNDPLSGPGQT